MANRASQRCSNPQGTDIRLIQAVLGHSNGALHPRCHGPDRSYREPAQQKAEAAKEQGQGGRIARRHAPAWMRRGHVSDDLSRGASKFRDQED